MIPLRCDYCGKDLKVKDELAGKKVKCPGCGKPVAVPEPAASLSPPPASADEKTLAPKRAANTDERTLPPKDQAGKSISDAGDRTAHGGGQAEHTQSFPSDAHAELTDFLAPPEQPDELGRLGGFRILKILGHGGMGVVFQGEDPRLGRKVAIKAMLPHLAGSKSSHERFLREAKAAAAIEHDHIVPIFHVAEDRGAPFIVMPFLQGEPLDVRMKRDKVLPVNETLRIGREAAEGLAAAHKRGLIHRDIKPANLWLEGDKGRVKILDFGLARATTGETGLTQTGAIVGTPQYMAPEQAAGKKNIDHRCDLFSLGCVLYRMCTGELPFKGDDTLAIISSLAMDEPDPPGDLRVDVPHELSDLIMQLLAKTPDDRPQTAQAVADTLQQIPFSGEPQATKTHKTRVPRTRDLRSRVVARSGDSATAAGDRAAAETGSKRRLPLLIGGGVLGVIALGLVVFFLASREPQRPENDAKQTTLSPGDFTNPLGMEFVLVPKGKSWLGGGGGKPGDKEIEVLHDFYLGKYEVTQEEWQKVMGSNPSHFSHSGVGRNDVMNISSEDLKKFPVESVSWNDCQEFLARLNEKLKESGWLYRLPKETEWEYACRGGPLPDKKDSGFNFYLDHPANTLLADAAHFKHDKGLNRTCKVGSYKANKLGLFDIHGNVQEWCDDELMDAKGAARRVSRSGSFIFASEGCRAAGRHALHGPPDKGHFLGLRLARVPVGKEIVKLIDPGKDPQSTDPASNPDRRAAEWVLKTGGNVFIATTRGELTVHKFAQMPTEPFFLVQVSLYNSKAVQNDDLSLLQNLSKLRAVNLLGTAVNDEGLAHLKNLPMLEFLDLSDTQVRGKGLVHLKNLGKLAYLSLTGVPVANEELTGLHSLTGLVSLEIYRCRLNDAGLKNIEGLAKLSNLNIIETDVTDAGLASLKELTNLSQLNLYRLKITNAGLKHLTGLKNLVELGLNDTQITEEGIAVLQNMKSLARLNLENTKISDAGLKQVANMATLQLLRLKGTQVTAAGVAALQKALPSCKIDWDGTATAPAMAGFKNSLGIEFVLVPKGKSWLGGGGGKPGDKEIEVQEHFYLGKFEVTQEQWQKVMGGNPGLFSRTGMHKDAVKDIPDSELQRFPVEQVSWNDAQSFLKLLNAQEKETGWLYRLPKELEWEYACRGGPMSDKRDSVWDYYFAKPTAELRPGQANFAHAKWLKRTCKVGSYQPNPLGLYDMHGNVWEWCDDEQRQPDGALFKAARGAAWNFAAGYCRAGFRDARPPTYRNDVLGGGLGLRVARVPVGKEIVKIIAPEEKKPVVESKQPTTFKNSLGIEFVLVPKGKSWLGGVGGNPGINKVEIPYDFYLGRYEVTQEEWEKVTGPNPSSFKVVPGVTKEDQKRFPVENVSWDRAQVFIEGLNKQVKDGGWVYRLPTEVEWEYACRGGPMKNKMESGFDFYFEKPTNTLLPDQANFAHDEGWNRTCKVGSYQANRLGLYDMHGNVWELCADELKEGKASLRMARGGCWFHDASSSRAASRTPYPPSVTHNGLGLRLARVPIVKEIVKIVAPEEKQPDADTKQSKIFTNNLGVEFVLVPKGKSWLGGGGGKPGQRDVEIGDDFYLGKYEVTQEEWEKVTGSNPSHFKAVGGVSKEDLKRFPVETFSWADIQAFIAKLNAMTKEDGWIYRLPTETEWEYACRGGPMKDSSESAYDFYLEKAANEISLKQANAKENGKGLDRPSKVGSYPPNKLGLHDMHGNLWEWMTSEIPGTTETMLRGGSWTNPLEICRAGYRASHPQVVGYRDIGLRLARVRVQK